MAPPDPSTNRQKLRRCFRGISGVGVGDDDATIIVVITAIVRLGSQVLQIVQEVSIVFKMRCCQMRIPKMKLDAAVFFIKPQLKRDVGKSVSPRSSASATSSYTPAFRHSNAKT